jgi:hypothetical protein
MSRSPSQHRSSRRKYPDVSVEDGLFWAVGCGHGTDAELIEATGCGRDCRRSPAEWPENSAGRPESALL